MRTHNTHNDQNWIHVIYDKSKLQVSVSLFLPMLLYCMRLQRTGIVLNAIGPEIFINFHSDNNQGLSIISK